MRKALLFAVVLSGLGFAQRATAQSSGDESITYPVPIATLDAHKLDLTHSAVVRFRALQKNWTCFDAEIFDDADGGVSVAFIPKDNVKEGDGQVIVNASSCGQGMTISVSSSGKVTRVVRSR